MAYHRPLPAVDHPISLKRTKILFQDLMNNKGFKVFCTDLNTQYEQVDSMLGDPELSKDEVYRLNTIRALLSSIASSFYEVIEADLSEEEAQEDAD